MRVLKGRTRCSIALFCYLLLRNGALAVGTLKLGRLRGHRESSINSASEQATFDTDIQRNLATMWENTEAELHVLQQNQQGGENRGPVEPQEENGTDNTADGEPVSEQDWRRSGNDEEHSDVFLEEAPSEDYEEEMHLITKEEPKGLYNNGGEESKPKGSKVKGERSKTSEELKEGKEDEEKAQLVEHEDDKGKYEEQRHAEPHEEKHKGEKPKREDDEEIYVVEDDEDEMKQGEVTMNPPKPPGSGGQRTPGKEGGKGEGIKGGKEKDVLKEKGVSIGPPQVTEIHVGFQYQLSQQRTASLSNFAELAKATSHVCDYIFRHYFMDIEEVQFLSTDRLAIYDVKGPTYAIFTVAAYFAADSSLPNQQQLTDIITKSLLGGSTYHDYYVFLLHNLEDENAFRYVKTVELYSQTSKLTGPTEIMGQTKQASGRLFKVAVPIVVLLLVSVVTALVYISWVESHHILDPENGDLIMDAENRKVLSPNDGESTLPSHGDGSFTEKHSFGDESASISESSAHFIDEMIPPTPRKRKQVRVSPKVLYRTFNPAEFSSRIDFEEVSLRDDDEKQHPLNKQLQATKQEVEEEVLMTKLMDDFAAVLNAAPLQVCNDPAEDAEVVEQKPIIREFSAESIAMPASGMAIESALLPSLAPSGETDSNAPDPLLGQSKRSSDDRVTKKAMDPTQMSRARPQKVGFHATSLESPSPMLAPKLALQNMNLTQKRVAGIRPSPSDVGDDEKTCSEDEYEEELLEEEEASVYEEEELASVYEEEIVEDGEEEDILEDSTDEDLAAIETALWGRRTPKPRKQSPGLAAMGEGDVIDKSDSAAASNETCDAPIGNPKLTPPIAPRKVRDFWEKKVAKQGTVRDFWEQKTKPKPKK